MSDPDSIDIKQLGYIWNPQLEPLFQQEGRDGVKSAWYAHVPFAHWVIGACKPRTLVELGTDKGVSYSAFCEAVMRTGLKTRCFAVDTWQGDAHAGEYGEDVYFDFRRFHDDRYGTFSELLRTAFDAAVHLFQDGSVDLLHIDGFHTYEAVRHDFETWRSKLSDRAVVLFHDTNVRQGDFGVWRFWEELRAHFPSFEFLHGHGLGVLAFGNSLDGEVRALCSLSDEKVIDVIRHRFSFLGDRWIHKSPQANGVEAITAANARIRALEAEVAQQAAVAEQLRARVAQRAKTARADLAVATVKNSEAAAQVANANARLETLEKRAAEALMRSSEIASLSSRESSVANSRSTPDRRKRPCETVVFYISGEPDTPGNVYRVERYVESLVEAGVRASWTGLDDVPANAQKIAEADLVIIWRAAWDERVAFAIEMAHRNGVRIIYDIDDLLIDPDLVRMELIDGIRRSGLSELDWRAHCSRFQTTMMKSVICTAPTQELATHMRRLGRPALVLPNTFGYDTYALSRSATRRRRAETGDGLIRIGYAGGTSTHQRDFELIAEALARVLSERPQSRLVLFQLRHNGITEHRVDLKEFSLFQGTENQIEWRDTVPLPRLPEELARFDINLAPVEVGNVFCESKSELKYFEAALVDVPTIASPTGPYRRAIRNGVTGLLAHSPDDWYEALVRLIDDPVLSKRISRAAHRDALARFGPLRRADETMAALPLLRGDVRNGARAFAFEAQRRQTSHPPAVSVPECEVLFELDQFASSELTVVLPLDNILQSAVEALETIRAQTLERFDLIVVANESTSQPGSPAANWVRQNAERFNRLVLLQISDNSSRSLARNAGIDKAETLYVFPLDPVYRLSPGCLAAFLKAIQKDRSPFVYSIFCQSGNGNDPNDSLTAGLYANGQRIPVTGLVTKEAWAAVGGYAELTYGGDGIDFWLKLIEQGWLGSQTGDESLIGVDPAWIESELKERKSASQMIEELAPRHPWLFAR